MLETHAGNQTRSFTAEIKRWRPLIPDWKWWSRQENKEAENMVEMAISVSGLLLTNFTQPWAIQMEHLVTLFRRTAWITGSQKATMKDSRPLMFLVSSTLRKPLMKGENVGRMVWKECRSRDRPESLEMYLRWIHLLGSLQEGHVWRRVISWPSWSQSPLVQA